MNAWLGRAKPACAGWVRDMARERGWFHRYWAEQTYVTEVAYGSAPTTPSRPLIRGSETEKQLVEATILVFVFLHVCRQWFLAERAVIEAFEGYDGG